MTIRKIGYVICILVLFGTCVYKFEPPSEGYENLLVVEALLTNGDDPFEVKLSRSIPIDEHNFIPEENAQISITDNTGSIYDLYQESPGRYLSYPGFKGETGKEYQLQIQTADGEQYISESVLLRETPPIDSVYYRYEERVIAESKDNIPGLQIYVTTHDADNDTWYYRWDYKETWEFRTKYNSTKIWEDGMLKEREEQIYLCWRNHESSSVLLGTSKNLNEDIIFELPLVYISNATDRLISKYSILVKQYSLSEESYNYWKDLEKINENLGTLFDPQPYVLKGNIHNINDDNDIVLGFFDASSVQEERIFITRGEFPYFAVPNYYAACLDTVVGYGLIPEMILQGFMLVGEVPPPPPGRYLLSFKQCIDCRLSGTNVKPDFWE